MADVALGSTTGGVSPAQIAKGALRRLALSHQEPTPENYARAYAEESGQPVAVLPERARPLLEKLVARGSHEAASRERLVTALMQGRWEQAGQMLGQGSDSAGQQAAAWATLLERLLRGLERSTRQWTLGRKKESVRRVLDSSRSDLQRLQQRLGSLVSAWDTDGSTVMAELDELAQEAEAAESEAAAAASTFGPSSMFTAPDEPAIDAGAWPLAVDSLRQSINAGLPAGEPRALELADRLATLADQLAAYGPSSACLQALEDTCAEVRRLFGHRHRLLEQLGVLCAELGQGLAELAEDESWAQGQVQTLQARLAEGLNSRSVRAAIEILADTRARHAQVRSERDDARNALKQLIHRLLAEIGELGEHTGRFHENLDRHVQAIEAADSIGGLAGVVRELVDDSLAVQAVVTQAQQRLSSEHQRASQLEDRVRTLETELRKLSDEVCTDALTQVSNRRGLMQAFEAESARRERDGEAAPLAIGLIDIDNFKKLNDSLGHAAGDRALQALAATVRERLRPVDHLARFGGEEFVVLLPATPRDEAQVALTRLQRALTASLFMHEDQEVFVTFSAGVTEWRPGEALEAALERADEALYEAKRTGKNRTCAA